MKNSLKEKEIKEINGGSNAPYGGYSGGFGIHIDFSATGYNRGTIGKWGWIV